ncbi:hypothetical protein MMC25_005254 [Agyrium rufum]|nr:hypothetical protein [Agyrium rufum]
MADLEDGAGSLEYLQQRIQKLEFLITGNDITTEEQIQETSHKRGDTVHERLIRLEDSLQVTANKSKSVQDLLYISQKHPGLFLPDAAQEDDTTYSRTEKLSIINSSATLFSTTASRLEAIQDLPLSSAETSVALAALQPRLQKLQQIQQKHAEDISELTYQTASLLQRWYELWIVGGGDCWSEWEERLTTVEKIVRREEGRRSREAATI